LTKINANAYVSLLISCLIVSCWTRNAGQDHPEEREARPGDSLTETMERSSGAGRRLPLPFLSPPLLLLAQPQHKLRYSTC
jgi:hypothetical protein